MLNRKLRTILCAFLICTLLGATASVALASSVESNKMYYGPVNGIEYYNQAFLYNNGQTNFNVNVYNSDYNQVPIGYMGAKPSVFDVNGSLIAESDWYYNSAACVGMAVCSDTYSLNGYYYSKGVSAAYNGNGYDLFDTYRTPNLRCSTSSSAAPVSDFQTNGNGQTYGSALDSAIATQPDLVQAIGVDGTEGYVLSKDLNREMPKSPEEALAVQNRLSADGRIIPLYAVNGKTIIGEFKICNGEVQLIQEVK